MKKHPHQAMQRAYALFAPVYDLLFGSVLAHGRRAAVHGLGLHSGDRVLEVGVGTGLSLSDYPPDVRVTGIDLAPEMLARARARVSRQGLANVEALQTMDAGNLGFDAHTFDVVIAMYVVSVVDDPLQVVAEMRRVCKPGGKLVIVNHFRTRSRAIRAAEVFLKPLHRAVRFRSDLDLEMFKAQAALNVERALPVNVFGYSTVLYCRNGANGKHA